MRTLLILTKQPSLAAAIQSVLDPMRYQVVMMEDACDAESLLSRGAIDAAIVDVELTDIRATRLIEEVKRASPACPVFVYASSKQWEWEENVYMLGVTHVLTKPVRGKLLNTLLERTLTPIPPPSGPAIGSFNALHPKSKFLAVVARLHLCFGLILAGTLCLLKGTGPFLHNWSTTLEASEYPPQIGYACCFLYVGMSFFLAGCVFWVCTGMRQDAPKSGLGWLNFMGIWLASAVSTFIMLPLYFFTYLFHFLRMPA